MAKPTRPNTLTVERAREAISYDPETGILRLRAARGAIKAGAITGCRTHNGYLIVCIDRRNYMAHRLAWLITQGEWPPADIDHINRKRDDNRLANLRLATRSQNNANCPPRARNRAGIKGIYFSGRGKWRAQIRINGRQTSLGDFTTKEEAAAAYAKAALEHFGEYARVA